jgi:uncharacterized protein (TIGR02118 family)
MTVVLELDYRAPADKSAAVAAWFDKAARPALQKLPGLTALDVYTPEKVSDPYLDDGTGPIRFVMAYFADAAALQHAVNSADYRAAVAAAGAEVHGEAFAVHLFAVAGEAKPSPMRSTLSYIVRYRRPAEDEKAFQTFYMNNHPPILGKFPGIRNCRCYTPIAWTDPAKLPRFDYMLGNEVVFDDVAALDASLKSDVRHEARRDYKSFPKFSGKNTHYAMRRARLLG